MEPNPRASAPAFEPALDRSAAQSHIEKLRTRHDTVLALGQRRNRSIGPTRSGFGTYMGFNPDRVRHAAQDRARSVTFHHAAVTPQSLLRSQRSRSPVSVSRSSTSSISSQCGTIGPARPPVATATASSSSSSRMRPTIASTWPAKP
jgi:hypothetical protein